MKTKSNRILTAIFLCAVFLMIAPPAWGAAITVKGKVTDVGGEPLIGASVAVKGSAKGAFTDIEGNYTIKDVAENATLTFSYTGYKRVDEKVAGRKVINVSLHEDAMLMDELVVVGYGSLNKKEVSSSIVQVNAKDFQKGAMNNAMEMLTGKVAGLNISTTAAADPNGSSSLQVRGATSISAGNGPLVVIDGVAGGDIRTLSPQDIESISVLKDAASAAIYGTRGANGVILVTTKKGLNGDTKPVVTYDSYVSAGFERNRPEILSAEEWRRSLRGNDYGYNTNWYDEITRDYSFDTNQYLSVDGSLANGGYYSTSLNYKKANGLDIVSGREEYGSRAAVSTNILDNHLKLTTTLTARKVKETWGNNGMFDTALTMNPTIPIYNEDGSFFQPTSPTGIRNPVQELKVNTSQGNRNYVVGTVDAQYNIWSNESQNLSTTLSYSVSYNDLKSDYYTPSNSGESYWSGYNGRASINYQKWTSNRLEWITNYNWHIETNDVKLLGGYTWERSNWEQMGMENMDFTFDKTLWHSIGSGAYLKDGKANMYAGKSQNQLVGFFGRVNYNYDGLVYAAASIRREGSSKFGADHRWGWFPSASVAIEMAKFGFMQDYSEAIQSIKPRVSYGVTGRSDFDSYKSLATYSQAGIYYMDGQWVNGYRPSQNANPLLGWEKATSINVGVDFQLFNRINGSVEFFDRRSGDLLYNYTAPQPPFIYPSILVNVGTTSNIGMELSLNADVIKNGNFTWTSGLNYSFGKTRLVKLSNDIYQASYLELYQKPGVGTSEHFFRIEEGGEIGQFYGYEYAGVDENHNMLIYNSEGEKVAAATANPKDKKYIGNGMPTQFLAWNNSLRYGKFDLSVMMQGAFGFEIFNMRKYGMGLQGCGTDNVYRDAYLKDKDVRTGGGVISSYFLEKGDYLKLENVTLGYNVPVRSKMVDGLRLYVSAKNLYTFTKYSGADPSNVPSTGITPGIDVTSAYPNSTQVAFGVTLRLR